MLRTATLTLAALAALGGAAAAQSGYMDGMVGGHGEIDFAAIDTDVDGSLSRAELQARAQARLAPADGNGDGMLDRTEIVALFPAAPGRMIDVFSADPAERMADRLLALMGATEAGRVELAALADRRVNMLLAMADEDRDAAISQAEADASNARRADWRGRHGERHHGATEESRGEERRPERSERPRD
jgi:hypothetical protein